jgi:hypothetical protein
MFASHAAITVKKLPNRNPVKISWLSCRLLETYQAQK